jgi:plasmid maintenance system killer protein
MKIIEHKSIFTYLRKRGIQKQYVSAKNKIETGMTLGPKLKKRRPYSKNMWYFRINRQYRALCVRQDDVLYVYEIDDHQ